MYSLYIKFQEKIFTGKKIIQLWNFGNFGIPEIIPKILVTLRFSKISLHELKGNCKCFKMRYWPHFYVDPTHSNTYFLKVGIWRVLLQGTVYFGAFCTSENALLLKLFCPEVRIHFLVYPVCIFGSLNKDQKCKS